MPKMLATAAALWANIEGCVRASPDPMPLQDIWKWPSVSELAGKAGYHRVQYVCKRLHAKGVFTRDRQGQEVYYSMLHAPVVLEPISNPLPQELQDLGIQVNKAEDSLTIQFKGLNIRISVA